jgi:hypothetical protein
MLQAVQFDALLAVPPGAQVIGSKDDPRARIRQVQKLLDVGVLSHNEYQAKRTEIIKAL